MKAGDHLQARGSSAPDSTGDCDSSGIPPMNRAFAILGERWTLQILHTLSHGVCRFTDIHRRTGAPRDRLTDRLRKLETCGLIIRQCYNLHPARYQYGLSESGAALALIVDALHTWGEDHLKHSPGEQPQLDPTR